MATPNPLRTKDVRIRPGRPRFAGLEMPDFEFQDGRTVLQFSHVGEQVSQAKCAVGVFSIQGGEDNLGHLLPRCVIELGEHGVF